MSVTSPGPYVCCVLIGSYDQINWNTKLTGYYVVANMLTCRVGSVNRPKTEVVSVYPEILSSRYLNRFR